jgi:hypothetical protein
MIKQLLNVNAFILEKTQDYIKHICYRARKIQNKISGKAVSGTIFSKLRFEKIKLFYLLLHYQGEDELVSTLY